MSSKGRHRPGIHHWSQGLRARPPLPHARHFRTRYHRMSGWGEERTLALSQDGQLDSSPSDSGYTLPHTYPLTRPRTLARLQHRPTPPSSAREQIASSRRPAPCQLLPGPRVVPSPAVASRAQAWTRSCRLPLRKRCAPPTAVGHIEAGGGGRSSVASSPLPRWRLVPVSPQFLPYELGFLTLIKEEQVMRFSTLWETRVGERIFIRKE